MLGRPESPTRTRSGPELPGRSPLDGTERPVAMELNVTLGKSDRPRGTAMRTSAPSRAKAIATARPMPESPPVTTARLPRRRSRPTHDSAPWSAGGLSSASVPGHSCCWSGSSSGRWLMLGSSRRLGSSGGATARPRTAAFARHVPLERGHMRAQRSSVALTPWGGHLVRHGCGAPSGTRTVRELRRGVIIGEGGDPTPFLRPQRGAPRAT